MIPASTTAEPSPPPGYYNFLLALIALGAFSTTVNYEAPHNNAFVVLYLIRLVGVAFAGVVFSQRPFKQYSGIKACVALLLCSVLFSVLEYVRVFHPSARQTFRESMVVCGLGDVIWGISVGCSLFLARHHADLLHQPRQGRLLHIMLFLGWIGGALILEFVASVSGLAPLLVFCRLAAPWALTVATIAVMYKKKGVADYSTSPSRFEPTRAIALAFASFWMVLCGGMFQSHFLSSSYWRGKALGGFFGVVVCVLRQSHVPLHWASVAPTFIPIIAVVLSLVWDPVAEYGYIIEVIAILLPPLYSFSAQFSIVDLAVIHMPKTDLDTIWVAVGVTLGTVIMNYNSWNTYFFILRTVAPWTLLFLASFAHRIYQCWKKPHITHITAQQNDDHEALLPQPEGERQDGTRGDGVPLAQREDEEMNPRPSGTTTIGIQDDRFTITEGLLYDETETTDGNEENAFLIQPDLTDERSALIEQLRIEDQSMALDHPLIDVSDEVIGKGGSGTVHAGRWRSANRAVALKYVFWSDPTTNRAQLYEIWCAVKLSQEPECRAFVCPVEAWWETRRQVPPMLVVALKRYETNLADFLDGQRRVLRSPLACRGGLVGWAQYFEIALGLLTVLEVMHRLGMTHFDLKPANILLERKTASEKSEEDNERAEEETPQELVVEDEDESDPVPLYTPSVTDFGSSKLDIDTLSKAISRTGGYTLAYVAPEVPGLARYGTRVNLFAADMWSLGVMLIELLVGSSLNPDKVTRDHQAFRAVSPSVPIQAVDDDDADTTTTANHQSWYEQVLDVAFACRHLNPRSRPNAASALSEMKRLRAEMEMKERRAKREGVK